MIAGAPVVKPGAWRRVWEAIDERLGLSGLAYPVPAHANGLGYILGGITFFGFLILAATGIWLAQFYHPTPEAARQSIQYIMGVAPVGDVIRGIHFWVANLVMATVLLHMGRVFVTGSYKRPREANWLIGVGLLGITLLLIFSGTVLKWDQEGYEALQHNLEIGELVGSFGFWFSPEFSASLPVVGRLYMAHVVILPAIGTLLLIAHFLLVKRHGISSRPVDHDAAVAGGPVPSKGGSSFAAHLVRMTGFGLLILAGAAILSLLLPAGIGERPNPAIEVTKPWWMFLAFYPFEDWFGLPALIWAPAILVGGLALVPFVDRGPWRSPSRRRWIIIIGTVVTVALVALVLYAYFTPAVTHVQDAAG